MPTPKTPTRPTFKLTGTAAWRARQKQGFTAYLLPGGCKLFVLHKREPVEPPAPVLIRQG